MPNISYQQLKCSTGKLGIVKKMNVRKKLRIVKIMKLRKRTGMAKTVRLTGEIG
jgi:hypothetical protein